MLAGPPPPLPPPPSSAATNCCAVLELRQYTLHPGMRDTLVQLFDDRFVEGQEAHEIRVVGQFRDVGQAQRFVWVRGFASMESRTRATNAFYDGPLWRQYREAANATIIDSDNVLLLKPADAGAGLPFDPRSRPPLDAPETAPGTRGIVVATIHAFEGGVPPTFAAWFAREVMPRLARVGTKVLGRFVTETAPNPVTRLPVRTGEHVFVWFAAYADRAAYERSSKALAASADWRAAIAPVLRAQTKGEAERVVLAPTRRSLLPYAGQAAARRDTASAISASSRAAKPSRAEGAVR